MPSALDKTKYLLVSALAAIAKSASMDRNGWVFRKKRGLLINTVSDMKLLSELSGVAHVLYHPHKKEADIASVKAFLAELLAETDRRAIKAPAITGWAKELLVATYVPQVTTTEPQWRPDKKALANYLRLARKRTSVRYVASQSFKKDLVYDLVRCAIEGPSSCNKQSWRFLVLNDKETIKRIALIKSQPFIADYPYVVVACFDKKVYGGLDNRNTPYLDLGGALMNLTNAATAAGIASCWCNFSINNTGKKKHKALRALLSIPKDIIPVSLVCLGIAAYVPQKPRREDVRFYMVEAGYAK